MFDQCKKPGQKSRAIVPLNHKVDNSGYISSCSNFLSTVFVSVYCRSVDMWNRRLNSKLLNIRMETVFAQIFKLSKNVLIGTLGDKIKFLGLKN
jgi:hypothetical protein